MTDAERRLRDWLAGKEPSIHPVLFNADLQAVLNELDRLRPLPSPTDNPTELDRTILAACEQARESAVAFARSRLRLPGSSHDLAYRDALCLAAAKLHEVAGYSASVTPLSPASPTPASPS